ncbi:hypothetical protein JTE90_019398 [Oedothorax gibbosus]|uniref:Uncharacterized protein n=1 Tax=Oedothorax gibbosus TaxID=931172 RepID=A0AAV6TIF3_9ARAC|nr:hypothetical protein JTE90_019398 [Oedothorax gibbosus]
MHLQNQQKRKEESKRRRQDSKGIDRKATVIHGIKESRCEREHRATIPNRQQRRRTKAPPFPYPRRPGGQKSEHAEGEESKEKVKSRVEREKENTQAD